MVRLYEMAKNATTGVSNYVKEKVASVQNWVAAMTIGALVSTGEAEAAGECAATSTICQKFVDGAGPVFVDIKELSFWLVLGLLTITFIRVVVMAKNKGLGF
jgi:hypothetical protein